VEAAEDAEAHDFLVEYVGEGERLLAETPRMKRGWNDKNE
jgi:hypothetical protein